MSNGWVGMRSNSEVLLETAELISSRDSLAKKTFKDQYGNFCLLGALREVTGLGMDMYQREDLYHDPNYKQYCKVTKWLERTVLTGGIAEFNDRPTTTKEDAVLLLKRAAEREDCDGES